MNFGVGENVVHQIFYYSSHRPTSKDLWVDIKPQIHSQIFRSSRPVGQGIAEAGNSTYLTFFILDMYIQSQNISSFINAYDLSSAVVFVGDSFRSRKIHNLIMYYIYSIMYYNYVLIHINRHYKYSSFTSLIFVSM